MLVAVSSSTHPNTTGDDEATTQLVHDTVVHWLRTEAGVMVDQVDLDGSLLDLGIDSLGAATITCELEKKTERKIDPEVLYDLESIRELAEYLVRIPRQPQVATPSPTLDSAATATAMLASSGSDPKEDPIAHFERLNRRVRSLKEEGRYFFEPEISPYEGAWVDADGQRMLMLGSYEYLGLLEHPRLREAAMEALHEYGTGHHGARLLVGTTPLHKRLEAKLADFMDADDAIAFSSGYVTNVATISALIGPGECVIGDEWNHASIADGCRMSGAELMEFKHNDPDSLAEMLQKTGGRRTLVVVDSVFSMDGDIIDLPEIISLCKEHGALLMVDEAHSLGVLGTSGRGIQEHFDLDRNDIDIKMGTLSKSLASSGGFVAGREELITYLRHHARGYIFSGALAVSQVGAATAALEVIEQEPEHVERLWNNVDQYLKGLKKIGFDTGQCRTPIVPVMTRSIEITLAMTEICRRHQLLVVPVCFPAVPMDMPRLRTCVSSIHTREDIDFALEILREAGRQTGLIS